MWSDARGYQHFDGRGPLYTRGALRWAGAALVTAGFVGYQNSLEEVPYTHRRHAIFITQRTEREFGQMAFQQTLDEAKKNGTLLPPHHPYSRLVAHVGSRIAQVACSGEGGGYNAHMQGLDWQFAVINDPQVNAFVVPGGKVVVYTGLLKVISTEDELAAVLAHEAAHVVARHTAERLGQATAWGLASVFTTLLFGVAPSPELLQLAFFLPHSRADESEADSIGLQLLARACYDPDANVRMLQKLAVEESKQQPMLDKVPNIDIFLTHPLSKERAQRIREALPEAYHAYSTHCSTLRGGWDEAVSHLFG